MSLLQLTRGSRKEHPLWVFEAELDAFTGNRIGSRIHVIYDRGKGFRESRTNPQEDDRFPYKSQPHQAEYFDGNKVGLVWRFFAPRKTTEPTSDACYYALYQEVKRYGEARVREKYRIPASYSLGGLARFSEPIGWNSIAVLRVFDTSRVSSDYQKLPFEEVAGHTCSVYKSSQSKYWVEPESQLVLRHESSVGPPPEFRQPPQRSGYIVRQMRFFKSIPPSRYQLPPGTVVTVPKLLENVPLPPGVTRKLMTGDRAMVGFSFEELKRDNGTRVW